MEIRVAVIDDGVSRQVVDDLAFDACAQSLRHDSGAAIDSHGTTVAAIIRLYLQVPVRIGSYKVLRTCTDTGDINDLIHALYWCAGNNINVVHLSLGVVSPHHYAVVLKAIKHLHSRGCVVVAACKNGRHYALPACSAYAIGVSCSSHLAQGDYAVAPLPNAGIDFYANSEHVLQLTPDLHHFTAECNSNAAPVITAHVCNWIYKNKYYTPDKVKQILRQNATHRELYPRCGRVEPYDQGVVCYIQAKKRNGDTVFSPDEMERFGRFITQTDAEIIGLVFDNDSYHNDAIVRFVTESVFSNAKSIAFLSHPFPEEKSYPVCRLYDPWLVRLLDSREKKLCVPVLAFTGSVAATTAHYVSCEFQKRGYASLLLSDHVVDFMSGFFYFHPAARNSGMMAALVELYSSEFVCIVLDPSIAAPNVEIDILIRCRDRDRTEPIACEQVFYFDGDPDQLTAQIASVLLEEHSN